MKISDDTLATFILSEPVLYLNVEQQSGQVLFVGLVLQVSYAVPSTLVLFILRAV